MSDPQKYRTKEELEQFQGIDPVISLKEYIISNKVATQKAVSDIEERVEEEVLDAVEFADNSPFPEESEMYDDMFAEDNPYFHV